ncbi:uncharacterized protein LOC128558813 [Mercenaria mercenaria]|uniref:uncharacterized protein LOC128558813 n=1 Tax=Mercenaria mercenaria TaxID=6596 RepID=UPI00234E3C5D|nr:uncharacterized protein LOC128558813 [Mercenaria mercenaria]
MYGRYGSYEYSFIVAGVVLILGFLFGTASLWLRSYSQMADLKANELIVVDNNHVSDQLTGTTCNHSRKLDRDTAVKSFHTEIILEANDTYSPVSTTEGGPCRKDDMCNGNQSGVEMEKLLKTQARYVQWQTLKHRDG